MCNPRAEDCSRRKLAEKICGTGVAPAFFVVDSRPNGAMLLWAHELKSRVAAARFPGAR